MTKSKKRFMFSWTIIVLIVLAFIWITTASKETPIQDISTAFSTTTPAIEEIK